MNEETLRNALASLGNALDRFGEALAHPEPNDLMMDGTIQRFEVTFELFWKTLRCFLQREGIDTASPRSTLRHAYRRGLLDHEQLWLDLLTDRNRSSHVYDAAMAREIFSRLSAYHRELRDRVEHLKRQAVEE